MSEPQKKLAALLGLIGTVGDQTLRRKLTSRADALHESWRGEIADAAQELSDGARVASGVSWRLASEHGTRVDPSSKATRKLEKGTK